MNTLAKLKTHYISIYEPKIPRMFCFARKSTFEIGLHAYATKLMDEEVDNLLNRNNSPMTNARKDSSIEAPTPNIFSSSFNLASLVVLHHKFNMQQNNNNNCVKKFVCS
jgi:hypothetical protein